MRDKPMVCRVFGEFERNGAMESEGKAPIVGCLHEGV